MLSSEWEQVRRILAIRLDNIGDVVMLGPALRTIRTNLPQARVTLMASPAGSQVAEMLPWVDEVMTHRALWQDVSGALELDPNRELDLIAEIRRRHFDAAIIFTSFSQSPYPPAYVCYLAEIPIRLGQSKEFGGGVLSQWVRALPDEAHQVDRNLHLLGQAGFELADTKLELRVPDAAQKNADRWLRQAQVDPRESFIVLAPGASAQARRYDPARYAIAARLLRERVGLPIVLIGSAKENDLASAILGDGIVSLVGKTTVSEMAGVIRRAALLIANDSAAMHLADAFRRPMVILFSGTEYESQWRPRRAPSLLLRQPTDCSPCYAFRCPYNMECLDIAPERVVDGAIRMMRET